MSDVSSIGLWPQRCKMCGRVDRFNFQVADDVWGRVVPPALFDHVVCLPCFDALASMKGVDYAAALDSEMQFAGEGASLTLTIAARREAPKWR